MPRYFFHVHHEHRQPDHEGVELSGDKEAWSQATRACGEMMRDLDGAFEAGPEWRLEVVDETGRPVFTIHFSAERFRR